MCSLSDNKNDANNILDERIGRLKIRDKEESESDRQSLVLADDQQCVFSNLNGMLCENGAHKSKIQENRRDLVETCLKVAQCTSKMADTINIENAGTVHVGHVINITEQIVLNGDTNELELDSQKLRDYKDYFAIIDRMHWLAQPSLSEITYLKNPAHYVIICHTATQQSFTQAENILLLRLTQTFHIESQGWADIAYNFCIGCDGNAYEGRGWLVEGSHTLSYNAYSVGIAFIGCFLNNLPPPTSLKKCKDLIAHGVQIGAIRPDYELVAHCQCRPFVSPGTSLFKEIQTWDHFNPEIKNTDTCKYQQLSIK